MNICRNDGYQERMLLVFTLVLINLNVFAACGQDCSEIPKWFSEGQGVIEKDPSKVALSYLRLMEERAFKAAFVLITPEFAQTSDPQAFEDTYVKRKDWHTYADTVCTTVQLDNRRQKVSVKAFVGNEGYFALDRITIELLSKGEHWKVDRVDWKTVIPDVFVPIQGTRFDLQSARKEATAESDIYSIQLRSLGWLKTKDAAVSSKTPLWLDRLPDDNLFDAVQGYIRAIAYGDCCSALYYRTDPVEALKDSSHSEEQNVRVYFFMSADHEVDLLDDGTATVWTKVWFSNGETIVIQAVAFECTRVGTVWKIQGVIGGPKSYIAAGDFGDVCEVASTGE